jgi:hypothetical protein
VATVDGQELSSVTDETLIEICRVEDRAVVSFDKDFADVVHLCYRRNDSAGHAGRLYSDLVRAFDEEAVFFDLKSVPPGEDYRHAVRRSITESSVVLVVIGRNWNPALLQDPNDDVRDEIATSLGGGKRVIPVLVQGAVMPAAAELPEPLRELSYRHASEISDRHWDADVKALVRLLPGTQPGLPLAKIVGGVAVVALAAVIGFLATRRDEPPAPAVVTTREEASRPTGTMPAGNAPAGNAPTGNAATGNEPTGNQPTGSKLGVKLDPSPVLALRTTITTRSEPVIPLTAKSGASFKAQATGPVQMELRLERRSWKTAALAAGVATTLTAGEHDLILNIERGDAPWERVIFTVTISGQPRSYIFSPKDPPAGAIDTFRWRISVKD